MSGDEIGGSEIDDFIPDMEGDCPDCYGTGEIDCRRCEGSGCRYCLDGQRTCPACGGMGYAPDDANPLDD